MKLSEFMTNRLNEQMNNEFLNERIYLALADYFQDWRLDGFVWFMESQAQGEHGHAMKFYEYIHDRLSNTQMRILEAVNGVPASPLDAFQKVMEIEEGTTRNIYQLIDDACGECDHGTSVFLQWFVTEQVEEENTVDRWLALVERATSFNELLEINELLLEEKEDNA